MTQVKVRDWTAYSNEDGEPWAVFLHGHDHDLRTLKSVGCKKEIIEAFDRWCGDHEPKWFSGNLNIGRWWIRDTSGEEETDDDAGGDWPWHFCEKGDKGAIPITGAKF